MNYYLEDGTKFQEVNYKVNGHVGWFKRGFHEGRQEYLMIDSYFDRSFPRWIKKVNVPLVEGKGIPIALYLEIYLMKKLGVDSSILKTIKIFNVHEIETIFQLGELSRDDPKANLRDLFMRTKLFKSRNNVIIQSGMKIHELKIELVNPIFNHPDHLIGKIRGVNQGDIDKLCNKYQIEKGDLLLWGFDVEIKLF